MRRRSILLGEVLEAEESVAVCMSVWKGRMIYLHNSTMAMAMRIMRRWWKPRKGMKRCIRTAKATALELLLLLERDTIVDVWIAKHCYV